MENYGLIQPFNLKIIYTIAIFLFFKILYSKNQKYEENDEKGKEMIARYTHHL